VRQRDAGIRIADGKQYLLADRQSAAAQPILSARDREQEALAATHLVAA